MTKEEFENLKVGEYVKLKRGDLFQIFKCEKWRKGSWMMRTETTAGREHMEGFEHMSTFLTLIDTNCEAIKKGIEKDNCEGHTSIPFFCLGFMEKIDGTAYDSPLYQAMNEEEK